MHVDKAYKGVSQQELTLFDDGMCDGPDLRVGEQFLMYTRSTESGEVPSRGCSRSRSIQYAEEDLQYLEGRAESAPVARIFGQTSYSATDPYTSLPLPGTSLELRGPEKTLTITADEEGRYSFDNLSAGRYSIHATHPGFRVNKFPAVDVDALGCAVVDVRLSEDLPGEIAGHLKRADGTPAAGIDLTLIQIDESGDSSNRSLSEVLTDEHGDYAFRHLRPGTYKVAVRAWGFPTPAAPYPAIYWPAGATEGEGAEIFVGSTADPRRYDFRLPQELGTVEVSGVVLLPDGRPAEGAKVRVLRLPDNEATDYAPITDSNGRFSVRLMESTDYSLEAFTRTEPELRSEPVDYSFKEGLRHIVLKLVR